MRSRVPAQVAQAQVALRAVLLPQPRRRRLPRPAVLREAAVAPVREARPRRAVTLTITWICLEGGETRLTNVTYGG